MSKLPIFSKFTLTTSLSQTYLSSFPSLPPPNPTTPTPARISRRNFRIGTRCRRRRWRRQAVALVFASASACPRCRLWRGAGSSPCDGFCVPWCWDSNLVRVCYEWFRWGLLGGGKDRLICFLMVRVYVNSNSMRLMCGCLWWFENLASLGVADLWIGVVVLAELGGWWI